MEAILLRLLDLAILGGEALIRAKAGRDKIRAMMARGGPTPAELDELERETDALIAIMEGRLSDGQ